MPSFSLFTHGNHHAASNKIVDLVHYTTPATQRQTAVFLLGNAALSPPTKPARHRAANCTGPDWPATGHWAADCEKPVAADPSACAAQFCNSAVLRITGALRLKGDRTIKPHYYFRGHQAMRLNKIPNHHS